MYSVVIAASYVKLENNFIVFEFPTSYADQLVKMDVVLDLNGLCSLHMGFF